MSAPVLEISKARRAFTDRQALHDVDLRVAPGEILALLGPNGAGKTSLMRAVAGRLQLDSGRVAVAGLDPHTDAAARAALGIVPQSIALYPQLTARQNLAVFARLTGLTGKHATAAVEEALLRAALQDRADERVANLSGGMQRRLNIVAGTLHHPQLLLLDEPTVGVDLYARESIHTLLRALRDAGMGILFSTHDFDQAAEVADRAAFMIAGRLVLEGPVSELIRSAGGAAKEIIVVLNQAPATSARQVLTGWHLTASDDAHEWRGTLAGAYAELARLEAELEQAGAHVHEIRVREPGLGSVFLRLMDQGTA